MKHIAPIKYIPGNLKFDRRAEGVSGHKYQGTPLRQLQERRKRSSSAPPPSSQNGPSITSIANYIWQEKPPVARFASTPLARYIAMRNGLNDDGQSKQTPMRPSELNSSIASSISYRKDDTYQHSKSSSFLVTESHDLRGNETSEIEGS
jgi:hypothetical protein